MMKMFAHVSLVRALFTCSSVLLAWIFYGIVYFDIGLLAVLDKKRATKKSINPVYRYTFATVYSSKCVSVYSSNVYPF